MNIFDFNYNQVQLLNQDGSNSRFSAIYGQNGMIVNTKKDSYKIISTEAVSLLAQAYIDKGYNVSPFVHKHGEVIGFRLPYNPTQTKVGDKTFDAVITMPNNGTGVGTLALQETRLICTNGARRSLMNKELRITVPHDITMNYALNSMAKSLDALEHLNHQIIQQDLALDAQVLTPAQAIFELNKWFFYNEFPESQKPKDYTFDCFRSDIYNGVELKCINRYNSLIDSFEVEQAHNETLHLKLSMYTVFATVTNYLSLRLSESNSTAPVEVQQERQASKIACFALN